jgi:hypothetical protein
MSVTGRDQGTHVLRHTAASAWLGAGVYIEAAGPWLGDTEHAVPSTSAHMMPDDDGRGRKAVDAFLAGSASARMRTRGVPGDAARQVSALCCHILEAAAARARDSGLA